MIQQNPNTPLVARPSSAGTLPPPDAELRRGVKCLQPLAAHLARRPGHVVDGSGHRLRHTTTTPGLCPGPGPGVRCSAGRLAANQQKEKDPRPSSGGDILMGWPTRRSWPSSSRRRRPPCSRSARREQRRSPEALQQVVATTSWAGYASPMPCAWSSRNLPKSAAGLGAVPPRGERLPAGRTREQSDFPRSVGPLFTRPRPLPGCSSSSRVPTHRPGPPRLASSSTSLPAPAGRPAGSQVRRARPR